MTEAEPLGLSEEDRALIERLREIAAAQRSFVAARVAMNAARPDILSGTPAEQTLYHERYRADNEAERAVWVLALEFARDAAALLAARSQPIGVVSGDAALDAGQALYQGGYHDGFLDGFLQASGQDTYPDEEGEREITQRVEAECIADGWQNHRDAFLLALLSPPPPTNGGG